MNHPLGWICALMETADVLRPPFDEERRPPPVRRRFAGCDEAIVNSCKQ